MKKDSGVKQESQQNPPKEFKQDSFKKITKLTPPPREFKKNPHPANHIDEHARTQFGPMFNGSKLSSTPVSLELKEGRSLKNQ
jgi:hypothetical protein